MLSTDRSSLPILLLLVLAIFLCLGIQVAHAQSEMSPNEQSLRDLIAAPSIVAFGFSSREEAVAGSRACVPTAVAYQRMPEDVAGGETGKHRQGLSWAELRGETGSVLRRLGRFLATSCSDVVTSAIVVFSSSNFVSAAIRIALGSSL